ncbi:17476_t:CDS:2, partial [Acaulospora morrowiae]
VHAYIIGHLKKEMPSMFGKTSKQNELIQQLDKEFLKIQQRYHLAPGDFPNLERFKQGLGLYRFDKFNSLNLKIIDKVEEALSVDLPKLMTKVPQGNRRITPMERNPFETVASSSRTSERNDLPPDYWDFSAVNKQAIMPQFNAMKPVNGKVPGSAVKPVLMETGLDTAMLAKIWNLTDWNNDGYMDSDQFAVAMHLCKAVVSGGELPDELPRAMIPNRKF